MSDVTELLDQLTSGATTVDDVADAFRKRTWPVAPKPDTTSYTDLARRDASDADAPPPGSFLEVAAAWHAGTLPDDQFQTLSSAAAEAMQAQRPQPGTSAVTPTGGTP
jgi:hypothetical protein